MAPYKNQHFVPQSYLRLFSKDDKTICMFNISNKKFIEKSPINTQCSKPYFYSKDPRMEQTFSYLEGLSKELIETIIKNKSLKFLSREKKEHLKSHILFQHGRTKSAKDKETDMANYMLNLLKPKIYSDAKKEGKNISMESINKCKIVLNSSHTLLMSMLSGILLYDLDIVLLENKSKVDFISSDNPVVLFNSHFNDTYPYGTTGLASTGLQIFYPISSRFMLFLFDSNFYYLSNTDKIKINKTKDVQRLNGLQIINSDNNIYFEQKKLKNKFIELFEQLKSKIPKNKNEYEICGNRIAEDGTYRELLRTSSPKINYNLKKLSFLKHNNKNVEFGIRCNELVKIDEKLRDAVYNGKIKSMVDFKEFISSMKY